MTKQSHFFGIYSSELKIYVHIKPAHEYAQWLYSSLPKTGNKPNTP